MILLLCRNLGQQRYYFVDRWIDGETDIRKMASDVTGQTPREMSDVQKGPKVELSVAVDFDDARLTEMGYRPQLDRKFSLLSCLAVGFSVSLYLASKASC